MINGPSRKPGLICFIIAWLTSWMSHIQYRRIKLLSVLLFLFTFMIPYNSSLNAIESDNNEVIRVLVLHSYHSGFSWTDGLQKGISEQLGIHKKIEIYTEYLDSKRYPLDTILIPTFNYLKKKYEKTKPQLLILADNNALTFSRQYSNKLFPDVPIVFCGINNFHENMLDGFDNRITGVAEAVDPKGTFELIRLLQPDLKQLIIITGTTPTAQAVKQQVKDTFEPFQNEIKLIWWDKLTTQELVNRLKKISKNDAVLLILFNRDATGKYYTYDESARLICQESIAPVYGMWDFYMGHGVVGGMMASAQYQGEMAGKLALSIINNNEMLPVVKDSPNIALFDYVTLKKYGLDPGRLPETAQIQGKPSRLEELLKIIILVLGSLLTIIVLSSILIIGYHLLKKHRFQLISLISRNFKGAITILTCCLLIALSINAYFDYKYHIKIVRKELLDQKKTMIVSIVEMVLSQIAFKQKNYPKDRMNELKNDIIIQLSNISYADVEGYIFVTKYDGTLLVSNAQPGVIGKNLYNIADTNGYKYIQEMIQVAKKPGGGFVSYTWNKPGIEKRTKKISYVRGIQELGWVVGTGVYLDDIDEAIKEQQHAFKESLIINILVIITICFFLVISMSFVSNLLLKRLKTELNRLNSGIKEKSGESEFLNPDSYRIEEFSMIANETSKAFTIAVQMHKNFQTYFNSLDDFMFVLDADRKIIEVNQTVSNRLGYCLNELSGQPIQCIYPASYHDDIKKEIEEMLAGRVNISTVPISTKDGFHIDVETRIFRGEWNTHDAIFGIIKDISVVKESEDRLQNIIKATNIGTWEWNIKTEKTTFNERWTNIVGYTIEELSPLSIHKWRDLIHPDDFKKSESLLAEHFNGNLPLYDFEYRMKHKNGSWVWVHSCGRVVAWADGNIPILMSGTLADITERKKTEENLRNTMNELEFSKTTLLSMMEDAEIARKEAIDANEQLSRIKLAVDESIDAIGISTVDGHHFYQNKTFTNMFGYELDMFKTISPIDLYSDKHIGEEVFKKSIQGERCDMEVIMVNKKGINFPVHLRANAIINELGEIVGLMRVYTDITARKKAENELYKINLELKDSISKANLMKKKAETANKAKSEFLANMSHEIRTPMNAIIGFSDLLSSMIIDQKQKSYLESIQVSSKNLLRLINDILDLSKIEAGKLEIQYEVINPYLIFNEIKQVFETKISEKNLDFIIEVDNTLPKALMLDEVRFRQILFNLIGNAVKFTEKGYIKLSVQKRYKTNEQSKLDLILSVEDTGIGIPQNQIHMIFESFKQQDGQSAKQYGGTGLGLSITKRLVEIMNGQISLQSTLGKGSIFEIILYDIDVSNVGTQCSTQDLSFDISNVSFDNAQILVVDDIESNRVLIKEALTLSGVDVKEAENGKEAVQVSQECLPDVIIMDIRMPVMDGYESTKIIKSYPKTKNIPIIALTANATIEEANRLKESNFDAYLTKPVNMKELYCELYHHIQHAEKNKPLTPTPETSTQTPNEESIEKFSEFKNTLTSELLPAWKELEGVFLMDSIESFAEQLLALSIKHKASHLKQYSQNLKELVDIFDIDNLGKELKRFPKIVDGLTEMK